MYSTRTTIIYVTIFSLVLLTLSSFNSFAQYNPNNCSFNGQSVADGDTVIGYEEFEVPFGQSCTFVQASFTCNQGVLQSTQPGAIPQDYPYDTCRVGDPQPCALGDTYGQQTVVAHGETVTAYREDILEPGGLCSSIGLSGNSAQLTCNN